ncbi:hypothetical protein B0T17DRAFT_523059 [Bombardia bombarda]|uniref:Secreted protein n=1 Tax=Bombardia bombarda TaxID=252184 RepID=A0AA39X753_9PEZI|nr:hypothetical protein B0T17DRAFT_523059 [Bombardia bombarda]
MLHILLWFFSPHSLLTVGFWWTHGVGMWLEVNQVGYVVVSEYNVATTVRTSGIGGLQRLAHVDEILRVSLARGSSSSSSSRCQIR